MFFSNVAMYFIILASAATLFKAGKTDLNSVAEAPQSLAPLAGNATKMLFALGVSALASLLFRL